MGFGRPRVTGKSEGGATASARGRRVVVVRRVVRRVAKKWGRGRCIVAAVGGERL